MGVRVRECIIFLFVYVAYTGRHLDIYRRPLEAALHRLGAVFDEDDGDDDEEQGAVDGDDEFGPDGDDGGVNEDAIEESSESDASAATA